MDVEILTQLALQDSEIEERLKDLGKLRDTDLPLLETAFLLSQFGHKGLSLEPYRLHILRMAESVQKRFLGLIESGAADDALTRIAALKHIFCDEQGYKGDRDQYDDLQNADLFRVIDRKKGLPISLAIIVISIGRAQGWQMDGVNFPGHFLVKITEAGQAILFDPFNQCKILNAPELRALAKQILGEKAELSSGFYEIAHTRMILLRLQNNIKTRLIEGEEYEKALKIVCRMRLFAPDEYRLLFDEAILRAKGGEAKAAISLLQDYMLRCERAVDLYDAERLLMSLRESLN